jgi:hypothetical protein
MPEKPKSTKQRRGYLSREGAPPLALKLQSYLGNVWVLLVLGLGSSLLGSSIAIAWYVCTVGYAPSGALDAASLGRITFPLVIVVETLTVVLVTPVAAAAAFADGWGSKLVRGSPKSAYRLMAKRFTFSIARMLPVLLAAMPLEIVAVFLQDTSVRSLLETLLLEQVVLLATVSIFSAIGLLFSSCVHSWVRWAVMTYGTVLFVTIGPMLLALPSDILLRSLSTSLREYWLVVLSAVLFGLNPFITVLATTDPYFRARNTLGIGGHYVVTPPIWLVYTAVCLVVTAVLLLVTARRLRRYAASIEAHGEQ